MNSMFPIIVDILPEGTSGRVRIEHFVVSEKDAEFTALRAAFKGRDEYVAPGKYVRLYVGGELMMSDTSMEKRSNVEVVHQAKGHVLIAGLGIGMIVHPIAAKREVKSITIVEKSHDVIRLVAPTLPKKATVVEGDIFTWERPKTKYDTIYFDIWPGICTDNLDDIAKLNRRFARYKAPGAWVNSWQRELLLYRRRQENH